MTLQVTFAIDPGITGAIAVLVDGEMSAVLDMPTQPRELNAGNQVDARALANFLRGHRARHAGAAFVAVLEKVGGLQGQSASLSFNFGENVGVVRGVLGALGIEVMEVRPQAWKKHFGLIKSKTNPDAKKDDARVLALQLLPAWSRQLERKRDGGRADAMLMGLWSLRAA